MNETLKEKLILRSYQLIGLIGVGIFAHLVFRILDEFAFSYTDLDQVVMWNGAHEFSNLRFHQPRFFGQAYGSMIESFVALPLLSLASHIALPIATTILFLFPFALMVLRSENRFRMLVLVTAFLCMMPVYYLMHGTMPRDFVPGIAVTSLALIWLDKDSRASYFYVGLFAVIGWSVNHSAVVFGIGLLAYKFIASVEVSWRRTLWLILGSFSGLGLHLLVDLFFYFYPEYILHHAWPFAYDWEHLMNGLSNLDRHWGNLTPVLKRKGWLYLVLIPLLIAVFWRQNKKAAAWSAAAIILFAVLSLGVYKVHDGFKSIYSSYERMYLALPVALMFLLSKVNFKRNHALIAGMVGIAYAWVTLSSLEDKIERETFLNPYHLVVVAPTDEVLEHLEGMKAIIERTQPDLVMLGPECHWLTAFASVGSFLITEEIPIVYPKYERRTWVMREVDRRSFTKILWFNDKQIDSSMHPTFQTDYTSYPYNSYLIKGDSLRPFEIYRDFGYEVSDF